MGGAAGHMQHVYEDVDLTFGQLKKILTDLFLGDINVVEKVDGQNLFVTYNAEGLRAARNLSDIRAGGTPASDFLSRWKGHPAEVPFTQGFSAIERAFSSIPAREVSSIFGSSDLRFVNLEIICSTHPNTIQYGSNYIVLHGMSPKDAESKAGFDRLVGLLQGKRVTVESTQWEIRGPGRVIIEPLSTDTFLDKAITKIDDLGMRDSATIGDFVAERLRAEILSDLPTSVMKQEKIIDAVLSKPSAPSVVSLKSGEPPAVQKLISQICTQENARKTRLALAAPIVKIIDSFATSYLSGVKSTLTNNHEGAVNALRSDVADAVEKLRMLAAQGDARAADIMNKHLPRLGNVDNITSSVEGAVFEDPETGSVYKLTGAFAPINQMLGYAKRN